MVEDSQQRNVDALLVVRCQLGERDAWRQLVERWHPRLWRFTAKMLSDKGVAEDVSQRIWLRIVRSLIQLKEPEKLAAWIYRIARFTIADQLRDQYRKPPEEELPDVDLVDHNVELVDTRDSIENWLTKLHPNDREAVVLHYLEQRPINEVAEICDVQPGTIKSRLHRARRAIRKTLSEEREHEQRRSPS